MPVPDHGGFDLTIEIAEAAISAVARSLPVPPISPKSVTLPQLSGQAHPKIAITHAKMSAPDLITVHLDLAGSKLTATTIVINGVAQPVPAWMQTIKIAGTVQISDRIEVQNRSLVVDFKADSARGHPSIAVDVNEAELFDSPLLDAWLAQVILLNPTDPTAYDRAKANLVSVVETEITTVAKQFAQALGVVTLVAPPTGLPIPVSGTSFRIGNQALHILFSLGGPAGNPALITRSSLLRATSTGAPAEVAAVILSNASLLRDLVCPAATAALGLPAASLLPGEPCFFAGPPVPISLSGMAIPGITGVTLNTLSTGIDESGLLHIVAGVTANGIAGAFTINATVDTAFTITVAPVAGGSGVTITAAAAAGQPVVTSDVVIPVWVYVAAALGLGLSPAAGFLLVALAAIDAFGGLLLNGPIATAITPLLPALTVTLLTPAGAPAVSVRATNLNQSDAPRRAITIGSISIPAPFRDHDLIVNLN